MIEVEGLQRVVRVVIVDDDPFVVQALRSYLSPPSQVEVLSAFASTRGPLAFLKRASVDVFVSDVCMPGMDGLELLARVQEEHLRITAVMLMSLDDDSAMLTALPQQVNRFLFKDSSPEDVIRAVTAIRSGGTIIPPTMTSWLVSQHLRPRRAGGHPDLIEAEQAALGLLCKECSNAEIAGCPVVAESTVKAHISNLMKKHRTPSWLELVVAVH